MFLPRRHHIPCTMMLTVELCALLEERERELSAQFRCLWAKWNYRPKAEAASSRCSLTLTSSGDADMSDVTVQTPALSYSCCSWSWPRPRDARSPSASDIDSAHHDTLPDNARVVELAVSVFSAASTGRTETSSSLSTTARIYCYDKQKISSSLPSHVVTSRSTVWNRPSSWRPAVACGLHVSRQPAVVGSCRVTGVTVVGPTTGVHR